MGINVNLNKLLLLEIWIDDSLQRVEYESLPIVCFSCGRCSSRNESQCNNPSENQPEQPRTVSPVEKEKYVDWMVVQRTSRKQTWKGDNSVKENQGSNRGRSKFDILANSAALKEVNGASFDDLGGFSLGSARQTPKPNRRDEGKLRAWAGQG